MIAELLSALAPAGRALARPLRNSSLEDPALDLHDAKTWEGVLGGPESLSGISVNHHKALSLAAVWQAVSLISGDLASLSLNRYRRLPGDDRDIDRGSPEQHLINVQWNEETSAWEGWRRLVSHALLWGNGYALLEREDGRPDTPAVRSYNLLPDRTKPARRKDGRLFYVTEVDGELEPLLRQEVFHLKGLSIESGKGYDLVDRARNALGLALAAEGFGSRFFANGAQAGGVLQIPPHYSEKAAINLAEGWRRQYSGQDNWFKVAILRDGAKFQSTTVDAEKAQLHELREDQARDVARFFNLPAFKLGLSDSVSYNSAEMSQLMYLQSCLNHWRHAITGECALKLLTDAERRGGGHYYEHDVLDWLEIDYETLNRVLETQRRNEVISPNEWRRRLHLPRRRDPGGDSYANPNTKGAGGEPAGPPPAQAELLDVPDVRQTEAYDCGAAAARAVAAYFGVGPATEGEWIELLGTTPEGGTDAGAVMSALAKLGLAVAAQAEMDLPALAAHCAAGRPVVVPIQDWGTPEGDAAEDDGHYVVVIGVGLGQVFLHDPISGRAMMPEADFLARWHDRGADGTEFLRFGIAAGLDLGADGEVESPEQEATPAKAAAAAPVLACGGEGGKPGPCPEGGEDDKGKEGGGKKSAEDEGDDRTPKEREEDEALEKARDREDAEAQRQYDREDHATRAARDKEDHATRAARDKEDRDRDKPRDKEDAQYDRKAAKEHDRETDKSNREFQRDDDAAHAELKEAEKKHGKGSPEYAEARKAYQSESAAAEDRRAARQKDIDERHEAKAWKERYGPDAPVQKERAKEDAEVKKKRDAEDAETAKKRDAEDAEVGERRRKEEGERDERRGKQDDEADGRRAKGKGGEKNRARRVA